MEDKPKSFVVNGKEYPVPEKFTTGELLDAEQYFGVRMDDPNKSQMGVMAATLYVAIRRVDPTVSVQDIREIDSDDFFAAMKASQEEEAASPPTPLPSGEEPSGSSESSGPSSENGTDDPARIPATTGTPS